MWWLLAILQISPAFAAEDVSLFFQSSERIRARNGQACTERPIGVRMREEAAHLCGAPLATWRHLALSLLELPAYRNRNERERDLKDAVARNGRITEAYAQLYLYSLEARPVCGRSVLPWVGGASLGSLKSGQVMRSGLSANAGGIGAFDQLTDANYRPRFEKKFPKGLANYALESATLTLGEGNRAIFTDLFWQLLAGTTCGEAEVIRTIKAEQGWERDPKLKTSARTWEKLQAATQTCDPEAIIEANKGFVEVEQYYVGQEAMYEGLKRQLGGWLLSPLIENAVPRALGNFPTFTEYAARYRPKFTINFGNPEQRVPWMKDQLAVMEQEFQSKADLLHPLFCAAIQDSARTEEVIESLNAGANP